MPTPVLTRPEAQARTTFLAMMNALSHPGRFFELGGVESAVEQNLLLIGEALLDLESSFYTPEASFIAPLSRTSARQESPETAEYHFYPQLTENLLATVADASVGDMIYPDRSATLIVGCHFDRGPLLTLIGPGIQNEATIRVNNLPSTFWTLRDEKSRYPLGWDIFLVDEKRVVGLPRTTEISCG